MIWAKRTIILLAVTPIALWADAYSEKVLADKPVAYWRFSDAKSPAVKSAVGELSGQLNQVLPAGPRPLYYPDFSADNKSMYFDGAGQFLGVTDPGKDSVLDFAKGDSYETRNFKSLDKEKEYNKKTQYTKTNTCSLVVPFAKDITVNHKDKPYD